MADSDQTAYTTWHEQVTLPDSHDGIAEMAFLAGWAAALAQEQTKDQSGTTSGSFDRAWRPAPPRAYKPEFGFGRQPDVTA